MYTLVLAILNCQVAKSIMDYKQIDIIIHHVYSVIYFNTSLMMSQLMTINDVSSQFDEGHSGVNLLKRISCLVI